MNIHLEFSLATALRKANLKTIYLNENKTIKKVLKKTEALNITSFLRDIRPQVTVSDYLSSRCNRYQANFLSCI